MHDIASHEIQPNLSLGLEKHELLLTKLRNNVNICLDHISATTYSRAGLFMRQTEATTSGGSRIQGRLHRRAPPSGGNLWVPVRSCESPAKSCRGLQSAPLTGVMGRLYDTSPGALMRSHSHMTLVNKGLMGG